MMTDEEMGASVWVQVNHISIRDRKTRRKNMMMHREKESECVCVGSSYHTPLDCHSCVIS